MLVNHCVPRSQNLQLAMIEGTEITTLCRDRFVPTVIVGTSGQPHQPGAPLCERCEELLDIQQRWSRLKDERDRIDEEMAEYVARWRAVRNGATETVEAVKA